MDQSLKAIYFDAIRPYSVQGRGRNLSTALRKAIFSLRCLISSHLPQVFILRILFFNFPFKPSQNWIDAWNRAQEFENVPLDTICPTAIVAGAFLQRRHTRTLSVGNSGEEGMGS